MTRRLNSREMPSTGASSEAALSSAESSELRVTEAVAPLSTIFILRPFSSSYIIVTITIISIAVISISSYINIHHIMSCQHHQILV